MSHWRSFLKVKYPFLSQVFARTVICRDLDVATRVARTDGLDCITVEGFLLVLRYLLFFF